MSCHGLDRIADAGDAVSQLKETRLPAPVAACTSVATGLFGWYPLLLAAGEAQGDDPSIRRIAITLGFAGLASAVSILFGAIALAQARSTDKPLTAFSALGGVALGGLPVGLIGLIFALTFHW